MNHDFKRNVTSSTPPHLTSTSDVTTGDGQVSLVPQKWPFWHLDYGECWVQVCWMLERCWQGRGTSELSWKGTRPQHHLHPGEMFTMGKCSHMNTLYSTSQSPRRSLPSIFCRDMGSGHLPLCLRMGSVWREPGVSTTRSESSLHEPSRLGCRTSSLGLELKPWMLQGTF